MKYLSLLLVALSFSMSAQARFLTEDPLGFDSGDTNFYVYVKNNPINYNDPTGQILNFALGAAANVAVGGAVRGFTGGNVFSPSAIATDFAIGAATSGLGAWAQIRHTKNLVNAARAEGRITGTAQAASRISPTYFHAAASEQQAINLLNQGAGSVFLNRAYTTATGLKASGRRRLPDVLGVFDDGSVKAIEIASKTDKTNILLSRNMDAMKALGLNNRGVDVVETAFSFRSPVKIGAQRTIGASGLKVGNVGATGIIGGNAITAGRNYNQSANGGYVLYPSRPNINMLNSVYSK